MRECSWLLLRCLVMACCQQLSASPSSPSAGAAILEPEQARLVRETSAITWARCDCSSLLSRNFAEGHPLRRRELDQCAQLPLLGSRNPLCELGECGDTACSRLRAVVHFGQLTPSPVAEQIAASQVLSIVSVPAAKACGQTL